MANKVLNVLISVQDKFSKELDKLSDGLKNNEKMFKSFATVGAVGLGLVAGASAKAVNAFHEQEKAEKRLQQIATKVTGATHRQVEAYKQQASAMQMVGVVGDEVIIAGQSQIASFAKNADTVTILSESIADLAVAQYGLDVSQDQAIQTSNLLGKALSGQLGALTRTGILVNDDFRKAFENANSEMERAEIIAQIVADNYGGLNKAMRNTAGGGMKALSNSIGDIWEEVGRSLIPALDLIMQKIVPLVDSFALWVNENQRYLPIILGVVAGFSALLFSIGSIGLLLPKIISGFAMLTSPIGLAVVAIGLLTTALTYFYVTNETFRNIVNAVWHEVKIKIETVVSAISAFWQTHGTAIMNSAMIVWGAIRDVVSNTMWIIQEVISLGIQAIRWIWEEFGAYIQFATSTLWEFITLVIGGAINNVKIVLATVLALIRGDWEGVWNGIKNILSNLWETMKGIVGLGIDTMVSLITGSGIASAFGGAWEAAKGAMMAVIDSIKGAVQGLMDWISAKVQAIMGVLSGAVNAVKSLGSGAVNIAKRAVGVNDAIISPKGDIITTHPDDYLIATKDPHSLAGKGGITVNISGNTLLDSRGAEKIGELLMKELRRNVIPA